MSTALPVEQTSNQDDVLYVGARADLHCHQWGDFDNNNNDNPTFIKRDEKWNFQSHSKFPKNTIQFTIYYFLILSSIIIELLLGYLWSVCEEMRSIRLHWLYICKFTGRGEWIGCFTVGKGTRGGEEESQGAAS